MSKKHSGGAEEESVEQSPPVDDNSENAVVEDQPSDMKNNGQGSVAVEPELCEEEKLRRQVAELEDRLLRTSAEFDNYKKRMARQYEDIIRSANDSLIMELLEIIDNFERALNHKDDNTSLEAFRQGTELIFNQMVNLLNKYDIQPIEAVGQPFDPNLHHAMLQVDTDEYEENIVALEMAKGYRQGQRVIRHSKVGVSTGKKNKD